MKKDNKLKLTFEERYYKTHYKMMYNIISERLHNAFRKNYWEQAPDKSYLPK